MDRTQDALDRLLLRSWSMFNRCEGALPDDIRREAIDALRAAHEALDAATGSAPSFPYARFAERPAMRLVR